jgi:two-component system, cell cycle sensor histidine kinase and response regulator CckA
MSNNRILVVEDEHIVALDIKMHLEKYGYQVPTTCPSGEEALEKIEEVDPVLVLMDIKLQGHLDGLETAEVIRSRYRTPVILLTAYADEDTIQRAKLSQPFAYIIKPFEERELRTAIVIALYRHEMEQKVSDREKLFSTTLNSIGDGVVVTDPDSTITFANPVARRMLGREAGSLVGLSLDAIATLEERDLPAGDGERRPQTFLMASEAPDLPVEYTVTPLLDESGRSAGSVWVFRDVSRRLESEKALQDSNAQLRQAQKMEAVGRLSGGIAHDFNNLLTVIMGYSKLIGQQLSDLPPSAAEAINYDVDGIQKAAERSVTLTRQLLAFSRHQIMEPKVLSINNVIQDVEKMVKRLLTERIRTYLSLHARPDTVFVDQGQIEQVIMNLVVNARDAMAGGGNLQIRTRNATVEGQRAVASGELLPGDYVLLEIEDSGSGISPEDLSRIFEPFFTTKERGSGTGLGLSTVYGIVRQTQGHIEVESVIDHGTTFRIFLPLVSQSATVEKVPLADQSDTTGDETILLVEDDDQIRSMLLRVLRERGYTVLESRNAGEGLLITEDESENFDLVVSDVVMPHMTGDRLAERILRNRPGVKILLMSGYPENFPDTEEISEQVWFLQKPFQPEDFLLRVRRILDN